jgi:protein STE50
MSATGCQHQCNSRNTSSSSKVPLRFPPLTTTENEIAGDVLVHLDHEALKDLDVSSVGHRLYLLKQIYNLKIAHGIRFEKDDYVPICIARLGCGVDLAAPKMDEEEEVHPLNVQKHLRERDSKIHSLETEIKRVNDSLFRLKEELVPVFKYVREKVPPPCPLT